MSRRFWIVTLFLSLIFISALSAYLFLAVEDRQTVEIPLRTLQSATPVAISPSPSSKAVDISSAAISTDTVARP